MADGVDPATLNETLLELRRQNALIRQANIEAQTAAQARLDAENVARHKRDWINDEAHKIEKCEGLPCHSMREWLRAMKSAMGRTPQIDRRNMTNDAADRHQADVDREIGRKLMSRTARGALIISIDKHVEQNANAPVIETLAEMETIYLGADEPAARRSELEELRQQGGNKPEHQIPAYCRLFLQKAEDAYGIVNRNEECEAKLAELFTTSLHSEEVAREIFEHDPALVTLEAVQDRAMEIYNRSRRMQCAWKGRRRALARRETPMEIGPVETPTYLALQQRVEELEAQLAVANLMGTQALASAETPKKKNKGKGKGKSASVPQQDSTYDGPRTAGPRSACYECGKLGHFGRDCAVRAARLAREAAEVDDE